MSLSIIFFCLLLIRALSLSFTNMHFQHNRFSSRSQRPENLCASMYFISIRHKPSSPWRIPAGLFTCRSLLWCVSAAACRSCLSDTSEGSFFFFFFQSRLPTRLDVQTETQRAATVSSVRRLGQPAGLVEQVVAGCLQMTAQIILIPVKINSEIKHCATNDSLQWISFQNGRAPQTVVWASLSPSAFSSVWSWPFESLRAVDASLQGKRLAPRSSFLC